MRPSSAKKLLSACCGGYLLGVPFVLVDAAKAFYELRSEDDIAAPLGCGEYSLPRLTGFPFNP